MATSSLQVRGADSASKQKAIEDAWKMQALVQEECIRAEKPIPPYQLLELIGKGSYGRVYKATDLKTKRVVAVKSIDIEESDTLNPKLADTYSEFLKEVNALKLLRESGAKNINHVLDVLPVGQTMWMVTEYCAGGSVATLMKPTAPGGLQEKWIIPILREVAEAIYWVHKQGVIHRDIKCANVLITEDGDVQLCDFGVAGVIENKFDKRSTFIGTPHWMAPELFDIAMDPGAASSYGTEVDIWAFGAMVYEIASGLPPNVMSGFDIGQLGQMVKTRSPRLEGDHYSSQLKNLVSFCLETDPSKRPPVEKVQQHPYISGSVAAYPTAGLANLVKAYKLWEAQGGIRKSLFAAGGAQGPTDYTSTALANDEWNFSTTRDFDQSVMSNPDVQAVYDVYGSGVDFDFVGDSQPPKTKSRRRPPPQLPVMKAPLEKVFDPNTMSNYEDNSRAYYGRPEPLPAPPSSQSDLPLRDDSLHSTLRESLIDLDASLHGDDLSRFADMETIRLGPRGSVADCEPDAAHYSKPPLSDPADLAKSNRRTQDWKFPAMPPPASANPEMSRFPFNEDRPMTTPTVVPGPDTRPPLIHHPTDPLGLPSQGYDIVVPSVPSNRASVSSLIDLDESLPMMPELTRPSTANSDVASISGSDVGVANPFDLERHASLYHPVQNSMREPSIYVSDDSEFARLAKAPGDLTDAGEYPVNGHDGGHGVMDNGGDRQSNGFGEGAYSTGDYLDSDYPTLVNRQSQGLEASQPRQTGLTDNDLPPVPAPPSARVMQGFAGREEVRDEVMRLLESFQEHLSFANAHVSALPIRRPGRQGVESEQ
ncbi:hypothetical protein P8C59_007894 [Phyllachora maydis]|uniref:non-specific serine/threonine protein kinase n=1 Tax=Phyllachora maydis TaxID=1825666 RepID=A0AAD9MHJ7_9PEZI|nr:hypothetical protein P8C59_007894 [Phyllachora maydis]